MIEPEHHDLVRHAGEVGYRNARAFLPRLPIAPERFVQVVAGAMAALDQVMEQMMPGGLYNGGPRKAGCVAGCNHCCRQHIYPTGAELAYLVLRVGEEDRPALLDRARAVAIRRGDLNHHDRFAQAIPCPVLEGNLCGAYEARPAICRTYVSLSKRDCDKNWRERFRENSHPVPLVMNGQLFSVGLMTGVEAALAELGIETERAEMADGLVAMLEDDGAARWLAGEPVLQGIRHMGQGGGPESDHASSVRAVRAGVAA